MKLEGTRAYNLVAVLDSQGDSMHGRIARVRFYSAKDCIAGLQFPGGELRNVSVPYLDDRFSKAKMFYRKDDRKGLFFDSEEDAGPNSFIAYCESLGQSADKVKRDYEDLFKSEFGSSFRDTGILI